MPFFSVVIPVYNKEKFLLKTVESVLAQSYTDFEILIIDDGSTDNSLAAIAHLNDARIVRFSKENGGVSSARNFGIEKASGNYIAFIDADDLWLPNFLHHIYENISTYSAQKIFSTAFEIESANTVYPARYSLKKTPEIQVVDYFCAGGAESILWTSSTVIRKDVFGESGKFDENMRVGEDVDLWIRIGLLHPIVFSQKVLARYSYDPNSLTKNLQLTVADADFSKFSEVEKSNVKLRTFLDRNRFSLAIKSKLLYDIPNFEKFSNAITSENKTLKKRILLKLPSKLLLALIQLNHFLVRFGLSSSAFK